MQGPEWLPLGSIVVVQGGTKKMMIIARAVVVPQNGKSVYYDYGACLYPEGLMGDKVVYFNHDRIQRKVFVGFSDGDETLMRENLDAALEPLELEKGNPGPLSPFTK